MRLLLSVITFYIVGNNILSGQTLKGKVFGLLGTEKEIIVGADVKWINTNNIAKSNENGVFEISFNDSSQKLLIVSATGYISDTLVIGDITYISVTLNEVATSLKGVTVTGISNAEKYKQEPIKTEAISQKEISKSACCDMAGCFETQATVQPQTTNIITNSKELRILGLSGVYNQLLIDGMPIIQGLSYTYGISSYPGTMIDNIFVAKGANSVLQGYESISGQINLIPKNPEKTEKFFLNGYINSFGEKHLNANFSQIIGTKKKWSTLVAAHVVRPSGRFDRDQDGFLDLPLITRYMLYNKWKYGNENQKGLYSNIGIRLLDEKRTGGQVAYHPETSAVNPLIYGQNIQIKQTELYTKTGYRFNSRNQVALFVSVNKHAQHSIFGNLLYNARQVSTYANLQHENTWNGKHSLKYGISYRYHQQQEQIQFNDTSRHYAGLYHTNLRVPGFFAENTFKWFDDELTLITGLRLDIHQQFGRFFTPRILLKYQYNQSHTFRISSGQGWRQVFLFAEHNNILASSRNVIFLETLRPEQAMNWGVNYTYSLKKTNLSGIFSVDFYQTRFSNQFFPDYDTDPTQVYIANFNGTSISNALQFDGSVIWTNGFEVKAGYNFLDVFRMISDQKIVLPFNPTHRAMTAASYRPAKSKWYADMNIHWYDKQRLPNTRSNPLKYQRPNYSKPYTVVSAQLTYKLKQVECYAGCENIFDFRQKRPIIGYDDPFGKYFDTSSAWGPTRGRELYIGIRWKVK